MTVQVEVETKVNPMTDEETQAILENLARAEAEEAARESLEAAEDISDLLVNLDLEGITDGETAAKPVTETIETIEETDEVPDDLVEAVEAAADRAEIYAEQEATGDVEGDVVATGDTSASPVVKTAKVKAVRASTGPRPERDLTALPDAVFQRKPGDDLATVKATVVALRPTQVKIAEKFDQLWSALHVGRAPSTYVNIALKALKAAPGGRMSSAELVAAMKATGLKDGTARSQTGQIMVLFDVAGIATRSGQVLTMNPDSVVAEKLFKILGL